MSKRMTVEFSPALYSDIESIVYNQKVNANTKAEVIRNSIIMYKYLLDEIAKGNKLTIADEDNHIIKEIVMAH